MKQQKKTLSLRLPESLHADLVTLSNNDGVTITGLIRKAVMTMVGSRCHLCGGTGEIQDPNWNKSITKELQDKHYSGCETDEDGVLVLDATGDPIPEA